ncbi:hypothetical protein [Lapidilactobacillus bayanensis]|uniref:hypothetical protein n=1 Tax=Lapidilactobacillus bayanensis TaxID=2485998 RepID=UPI000F774463|nr:hypothetical protein [Lapidilactobacillus bayanensis]
MSKLGHWSQQLLISLIVLTISLLILQRLVDWNWLRYVVLASLIITIVVLLIMLIFAWLIH